MYSVDWSKLVSRNIPAAVRKDKLKAFLLALLAPVISLYNTFTLFRAKVDEDLRMTGQVVKLEWGLNQRFDPSLSRIEIKDASEAQIVYMFLAEENRPLFLPRFLSGLAVDFVVCIPISLKPQEITIRAFLDKYKLVTTRYEIQWI